MGTAVRGCGTRVAGGVYATCPTSPFGQPVEYFLIDPPVVVDCAALGLSSIGVKLLEQNGVWHVFDIIGEQHYPNVADFVEEVSRLGVSRRLPKTLEFDKLTENSRLILIHKRAHLDNHSWFKPQFGIGVCPKGIATHGDDPRPEMCVGVCWLDVKGSHAPPEDELPTDGPIVVERVMPWGSYDAVDSRIPGIYQTAIFASFPLTQIEVVRDPSGGSHEAAYEKASRARLPVVLEDE